MARFSFYSPESHLKELESLSAKLRVFGVELDETFLEESRQELLRAHFESGLQYVCLHAKNDLEQYDIQALHKMAFFCEANGVEAIVFNNPGDEREKAEDVLDVLSVFRVKVVFENKLGSFLTTSEEMNAFFRENRHAGLCFNPAEILKRGTHPFFMELISGTYRKNLFMIRVYEYRLGGEEAPPLTGDSELLELFSAAEGFGRDVWASLAPYGSFSIEELHPIICKGLLRV